MSATIAQQKRQHRNPVFSQALFYSFLFGSYVTLSLEAFWGIRAFYRYCLFRVLCVHD